jgi:uncharacterized RDD family membrane protein YckC
MNDDKTGNPYAPPSAAVADAPTLLEDNELASLMQRLGGAIVDAIVLVILVVPIVMFAMADSSLLENEHVANAIFSVIGLVFYLLVNTYLLAKRAQTVGKWVAGTKIVRTDGSPANIQRLIGLRVLPLWLVGAIPYAGGFAQFVNVLMIFRSSRKCLHDDIADTIVIKAR